MNDDDKALSRGFDKGLNRLLSEKDNIIKCVDCMKKMHYLKEVGAWVCGYCCDHEKVRVEILCNHCETAIYCTRCERYDLNQDDYEFILHKKDQAK